MKKIAIIFISAVLICVSFVTAACSSSFSAGRTAEGAVNQIQTGNQVSEQEIKDIFNGFIAANPNRYAFNADNLGGELKAAQYIAAELEKIWGANDEESDESSEAGHQIIIDTFSGELETSSSSFFGSVETETKQSQNVILRLSAHDKNVKSRIVIGCDYDNVFGFSGHSVGAIDNASGVATLLGLAKSLFGAQLPVNVDIVFFGAGYYSYSGSDAYIAKGLSNVIAMINVTRVSMDEVYIYSDEAATPFEELIQSNADFIKAMPSIVPLISNEYVVGYPYAHIGMVGNHAYFMSKGITCANIFGGDSSVLGLGWNVADGTVDNMERLYPNGYKNMASVCNVLNETIFNDGLIAAAANSKSAGDSPLMKAWIAYLIFIIVATAATFALWYLSRYYVKKYPIVTQRKVMPVFGSDYE